MARSQNCVASFLTAVGKLHSLKADIDLHALFPTGSCLPDLPRYPWNHESSHWYEPRVCREWRHRKFPYHDHLGVKLPESTDLEPAWRNMLHLSNVRWVRDHKVGEDIVFPFAGYVALAGEAVRQVAETSDGFSIRNIRVSMALVLNEGKPTEMITSFRPHRLTNSLNSPWWEFTVASYNGHLWTKHCAGEISALAGPAAGSDDNPSGTTPALQKPQALPRKLSARKYYENMAKGGLDLGPCFQTLESIETSTNNDGMAIGRVTNGRQGDEANYHIHPTVIDATIQILGAAAVSGRMRKTKNWLPTSIDRISISRCASNMVTSVSASLSSSHSVVGGGRCTSDDDGRTVLEVSGPRMSLADGALADGALPSEVLDTHAAARYEWALDLDFLDVRDLIGSPSTERTRCLRLLEELGQLCLLSSKRSRCYCVDTETKAPHLQRYASWLLSRSKSVVAILASILKSLDNETLSERIKQLLARLLETPAAAAATAIHNVCSGMDGFSRVKPWRTSLGPKR